MPETVVDQVLARTDADLRLGGVSLESTVMFTDLRGFTTFSEALPPARLIECLNVLFQEMTEAILGHGGTLVSDEGDGIMAVFGAPIEQPDHADRAVAASREMLTERLPKFNAWLRDRKRATASRWDRLNTAWSSRQRRLGAPPRVHGDRRHDEHRVAAPGMTKGSPHLSSSPTRRAQRHEGDVEDIVFIDEFEVRGGRRP